MRLYIIAVIISSTTIFAQGNLTPVRTNPTTPSKPATEIKAGAVNQWQDLYKEQQSINEKLEKKLTSKDKELKKLKEETTLPKNFVKSDYFMAVSWISFSIFILWILILLFYYCWAIKYHVVNYGISSKMWKILYPEALAMTDKGKKKFRKLRREMIDRQAAESGENVPKETTTNAHPFEPPKENKYKCDSFGLPPGTVRGTIALSALVMFLCVEAANFFSPYPLEDHFEELMLAVQMILAFYFGQKAVEVFQARDKQTAKEIEPKPVALNPHENETGETSLTTPSSQKENTIEEPENEEPQMPSSISGERQIVINDQDKHDEAPPESNWQAKASLAERVLALTASFETSKGFPDCFGTVTGNFDGQGISFGALQWNINQKSLQPILQTMITNHEAVIKKSLGEEKFTSIQTMLTKPLNEQMQWAKSIQYTKNRSDGKLTWRLNKEWKNSFQTLGKTKEMIALQVSSAANYYNKAKSNCEKYGLTTERGMALLFDIRVQNGSLERKGAGEKIREDFLKIPTNLSEEEIQIEKMKIIAIRRAAVSSAQWRKDVENRKLTIANGSGKVHGKSYDLKKDFNLSLNSLA